MTRKASPREIQETLGDLRFAMHSLNRADGPESSAVTRNRSARDGPERLARHQLSFNTQACTADRRRWSGDPCRLGLPSVVLGTPGVWWVNHWAWAPVEAPAERRATRTNSLRRCILTPPSVGVAAFYNGRQVFNFVKSVHLMAGTSLRAQTCDTRSGLAREHRDRTASPLVADGLSPFCDLSSDE
jgi:hypothetical protein